jgi:membrane protease YdiL (CAAX protease family)
MNRPERNKPLIKTGWLRALLYFFAIILGLTTILLVFSITQFKGSTGTGFMFPFSLDFDPSDLHWLFFFILVLAVTFVFRKWIDRKSFASLGFRINGYIPDALAGAALAIFLVGASSLILKGTGHLKWVDIILDPRALFMSLGTLVLIAIYEELIFRGYILVNLLESFPRWIALLISAVLFMIFHWSSLGFFPMVNTLVMGLVLGINVIYTRNLWFPICFHIAWKFLEGPVLGLSGGESQQTLLIPSVQGNENATGGANGLEGSFIFLVVSLLSLLVLFIFFQKKLNPKSPPVPGRI